MARHLCHPAVALWLRASSTRSNVTVLLCSSGCATASLSCSPPSAPRHAQPPPTPPTTPTAGWRCRRRHPHCRSSPAPRFFPRALFRPLATLREACFRAIGGYFPSVATANDQTVFRTTPKQCMTMEHISKNSSHRAAGRGVPAAANGVRTFLALLLA